MFASRPWLLWAVPFGFTAALAPALSPGPLETTVRLLCTAVVIAGLKVLVDWMTKADEGWRYAAGLGARVFIGSWLSGALALLFLVTFYPKPGITNLLWMLGIPALVTLGQTRRNLALLIPHVVFGWIAFALLGWALRIPLD